MGKAVLFGGYGGNYLGDTWTWDGTQWAQVPTPASPSPRGVFAMAYDAATKNVLLFGGYGGSGALGDTWSFNGTTWTQLNPASSPSPRWNVSMAYDPMTQRVVLFGGYNNGTAFNDTWTWDGSDWTEQNPSVSPSARYGDMISYNDSSGSIVLYGGQANGLASSLLSDTWTWDGSNWGQLPTAASPGPRSFAALNQQEGILFGDDGGGIVVNDCKEVTTWQVGASGWNELSTSSPPPGRTAPVMVYDPLSGSSIMFGGTGCVTNYLGDTWIFNGPTIITTRTSIAASTKQPRVGQLVTFTARVRPVPGGGKVNFFDNGDIIPGCTLVTVHISTGNAYCKVAFPSTGSYEIRTVYSGDQNYASSTSGIVTETPVTTLPSRFLNLSMGPAGCWSSAVARRKL